VNPSSRKLSVLQKEILRCLWSNYQYIQAHGNDWAVKFLHQGIQVKEFRGPAPKSGADRAAFSRALRRLEQRGLIVRTNTTSGMPEEDPRVAQILATERRSIRLRADDPMVRRTDHVILTAAGIEVAQGLNG
jgi:hypothetical protein